MDDNGVIARTNPSEEPRKRHDESEPLSIVRTDVALRDAEFMRLYLRGPVGMRYNGAECARAVGYSGDDEALRVRSSEVLHRPRNLLKIQRALDRNDAGIERVIHELACVGFAKASDFASWDVAGVALKSSTELDDDQLAAVVAVEEYQVGTRTAVRVKLADKIAALGLLGKLNRLLGPVDPEDAEVRPFTLILGQTVNVQQNGHPINGAAPTGGEGAQ